jgi:hypothetical protein
VRTPSFLLLLVVTLLFAATSCDNTKSRMVGKWRSANDADAVTWEFMSNGAAVTGNTRGKFSLGDQNRVKIQTPYATFVYQVEFSGDRMILKDPNGSRIELVRVE